MEQLQAMMANATPQVRAMLQDSQNIKMPEYRHRMNSIDSCSSDEGEQQASEFQGGAPPEPRAAEPTAGATVAPTVAVPEVDHSLPTQSLLHEMVAIDRIDKISKQLAKGIDVNTPDCIGETPLFWAESAEVVDRLVDEGADINWRNSLCECSAFYKFACQGKHKPLKALAKHLRRNGMLDIYVNEPATMTGRTPLHAAAGNGFVETVKELLRLRADPQKKDADGKTPVDLARRREFDEVVALLEE
mmetsp:Transcript_64349/g.161998  ORF Transcript_64349/g.161998 Transcript_64349/m.161998 type:complete len:246 (+) Transcript_64349:100-837(+)